VRWRGTLRAPASGLYEFELSAGSPAALFLNGLNVVHNDTVDGEIAGAKGQAWLDAGEHPVDLRYAWRSGQGRIEWYWTPPGGARALVPPTALRPDKRIWLPSELPEGAPVPQVSLFPGGGVTRLTPATVIDAASEVSNPRGIAADSEGNIYVGDPGSRRVVVYGPDGRKLRAWGREAGPDRSETPQAGQFAAIRDIAVGSDDSVYVLDDPSGVHVFSSEGVPRQVISLRPFGSHTPGSLALDAAGNIYIADPGLGRVLRVSADGASGFSYLGRTDTGRTLDKLEQPIDAAPLPGDSGEAYAVDMRDRIVQLSPEGEISKAWVIQIGRENPGSRIAASPDGRLIYMTDPERARVAVLRTEDGTVTYFGGRGRAPGLFTGPIGITVDPQGRVYVLDRDGRIQVFEQVAGSR
jgi:DNA-binding beta-propeller fold protein YncE